MCCFSRPVRFVGKTRIFARRIDTDRQVLAYAMDLEIDSELAMVLPLPVPPGPREDAVTFVNLEGYAGFFDDLANAFPRWATMQPAIRGFGPAAPVPKLVVHDVGRFEASFVPTLADFARLDARFRLPDDAWEKLPAYADWGFAVFRLKPMTGALGSVKRQAVHAMALSFPSRESEALYFPTVHVHDGTVHPRADFSHSLYCQAEGLLEATLDWTRSEVALGQHVDPARARGVLDGARRGFLSALMGSLSNEDVWLRPPPGVVADDLRGRGHSYAYAVTASHAYMFGVEDPRFLRWKETAATRLSALCRGLRDGLAELANAKAAAWRLVALTDELPPHFMNGQQLWTGTSYMNGQRATAFGPGRVTFSPFTENVAPQAVTLAFDRLPDEELQREIGAALGRLLDRAVAK